MDGLPGAQGDRAPHGDTMVPARPAGVLLRGGVRAPPEAVDSAAALGPAVPAVPASPLSFKATRPPPPHSALSLRLGQVAALAAGGISQGQM